MNYESFAPFLDGEHQYQEYRDRYSLKPMYIVYSLTLKKNRYYVGRTDNFKQRYAKHKSRYGCTQTKKYPVVSVDKIIVTNLPFMELLVFFEYTQKFGISNVRGDLFHRDCLPLYQEDYIQREIYHEENKCISCGSSSHFISQCPTKRTGDIDTPHSSLRHPPSGASDSFHSTELLLLLLLLLLLPLLLLWM